jgi:3-methyladenine DNA glycosylase Tag
MKPTTPDRQHIPHVIEQPDLRDYLDVMSRAVFQAGLSWAGIGKHWEQYREAFDNFDPLKVAAYTEGDVDRLMRAEGVLHSSRKIRATIENAAAIVQLDRQHDGFANYLRSFPDYATLAADFKKRFKFMGDMNVWYFLFRVHEPVPQFEHWVKTIPGEHPRMKEMVHNARAAGMSMEK